MHKRLPEEIEKDIRAIEGRFAVENERQSYFPLGAGCYSSSSLRARSRSIESTVSNAGRLNALHDELEAAQREQVSASEKKMEQTKELLEGFTQILKTGLHNGVKISTEQKHIALYQKDLCQKKLRDAAHYQAWSCARRKKLGLAS